MPKVRKGLKTRFGKDQIEPAKMDYLKGGDGDGDGGQGQDPPWKP